jgi:hypothetical protein
MDLVGLTLEQNRAEAGLASNRLFYIKTLVTIIAYHTLIGTIINAPELWIPC